MHFLGIRWDNTNRTPFIKYKNTPNQVQEQYLELVPNKNITIHIKDEKYCVGYFDPVNYLRVSCIKSAKIEANDESQCNLCRSKDSKYFLPLNTLNYEQIKLLETQPHLNYVNLFGGNIIKTGVAAKVRKFTRVLEQGAIATIFITNTDGYIARVIESLISKNLSIKQAVLWDTKIKNLRDITTSNEAQKKLTDIYLEIKNIFPAQYMQYLLPEPEYYFNFSHFGVKISGDLSSIKLFTKFSEHDVISGILVGIYGEIIFIKNDVDKEIYGINTKSLNGHIIEIGSNKALINLKAEPKILKFTPVNYENLTLF